MDEKAISVLNVENLIDEMMKDLDDVEDKVTTKNNQKIEDFCGEIEMNLKQISMSFKRLEKKLNIKKASQIIFIRNKYSFNENKRYSYFSS